MSNTVVPVKQIPDTWSEHKPADDKSVLDRKSADAVLDEINENAVEVAPQLKEEHGGNVTTAIVGPDRVIETLRKALSVGVDDAVVLSDDALEGPDTVQTAWALFNVIDILEGVGLIVTGNASTDGSTDSVPAILGAYRDLSALTHLHSVVIDGDFITGEREVEDGIYQLKASLPVIVSVTEKINSPRFAFFKSIMAAKKKPVTKLTLDDVAAEAEQVGLKNAATGVTGSTSKLVRTVGERINDEGNGGVKLVKYLKAQKLIQGA